MRGNSSGFIFRYAARLSLLAARLVDDSLGEHCRECGFLGYVPRDAGAGYLIHRADIDNPPPPGYCITASARRFRRVFVFARSLGGGDSRSQTVRTKR